MADSPARRRLWIVPGILFAAVSLVHLAAQLMRLHTLADVTQIALMPLLTAAFMMAARPPRSRLVWLVVLALVWSWLGDSLPRFMSGDPGFLTMVGCFLVAQVVFIVAFVPHWRMSVLRRPLWVLPYAVFFAVLVVLCAPHAGSLLVPVIIYGAVLMVMAVLSTGLGWLAGLGGAIFFVSDGLIALRSFADIVLPGHGFWVMATYLTAQTLLVVAVTRRQASAPFGGLAARGEASARV